MRRAFLLAAAAAAVPLASLPPAPREAAEGEPGK
jgi:hypothetical protein